jgi:hypothetical protein
MWKALLHLDHEHFVTQIQGEVNLVKCKAWQRKASMNWFGLPDYFMNNLVEFMYQDVKASPLLKSKVSAGALAGAKKFPVCAADCCLPHCFIPPLFHPFGS